MSPVSRLSLKLVANFGDPRALARTYTADYHFEQWKSPASGQAFGRSTIHLFRGVLVMLTLLFFNFFFILWPVLSFGLILLAGWAFVGLIALVSLICAGIGMIGSVAGLVFPSSSAQFALLFYGLGCCVLSGLFALGLYSLTRISINIVLKYIKLNVKLVTA